MNVWAEKTARLAQTQDYLDRLQEIYPVVPGAHQVPDEILVEIRKAFDSGNRLRLLELLLANRRHVIGEAKFLSDEGGNQRAGFRDAMSIAGQLSGRAVKVAVLDGVVWLKNTSYYKQIEPLSVNVFSALLLADFLRSLH